MDQLRIRRDLTPAYVISLVAVLLMILVSGAPGGLPWR